MPADRRLGEGDKKFWPIEPDACSDPCGCGWKKVAPGLCPPIGEVTMPGDVPLRKGCWGRLKPPAACCCEKGLKPGFCWA